MTAMQPILHLKHGILYFHPIIFFDKRCFSFGLYKPRHHGHFVVSQHHVGESAATKPCNLNLHVRLKKASKLAFIVDRHWCYSTLSAALYICSISVVTTRKYAINY